LNNEPVAYGMLTFCKNCGEQNPYSVKELTDEEITAISKEIFKDYKNFHHYQIDFARAILRKAQDK
jgi:type VI protein secretion system component Hcp